MTKYKGIPQSTDQVKAFLDGRRTRISVPVKPQPEDCTEHHKQYIEAGWKDEPATFVVSKEGFCYCQYCGNPCGYKNKFKGAKVPHQIGDIVFVKEGITRSAMNDAIYLADGSFVFLNNEPRLYDSIDADYFSKTMKTIPSIHMPQEAARIWLKIDDVKVERLQNISDTDIVSEGIRFPVTNSDQPGMVKPIFKASKESALSFMPENWETLKGNDLQSVLLKAHFAESNPKAWKENKWHSVYTVEIIDKPSK